MKCFLLGWGHFGDVGRQLEWQGPWVCGHYGEEGDYIKEDKDSLSYRVYDAMNLAKLAELLTLNIQYMRSLCSLYTSSKSE